MANPWDKDPIVNAPRSRNQPRYETISSSYTNETPEQLRAQGYEQDANGTWARVVEQVQEPAAAPAPWANDTVATPSQLAAESEAHRRIAEGDPSLTSGGGALFQGLTLGYADELAGLLAGAGQAGRNAIRTAQGQPIEIQAGDLRNAVTQTTRGESERFAREQPLYNFGLQAAGGLLTGGAGATRAAGVAAARQAALQAGNTALARQLLGQGIREGAQIGGAYGAAYGFGSAEGGFADRLPSAVGNGLAGATLAGGITGATPYVAQGFRAVGDAVSPFTEGLRRILPGNRPEPQVVAARRLTDQFRRQRNTPDIQAAIAERRAAGLEPSIVDVGGENLRATVRAAASGEGPGRELATQYAEGIRASAGPRAIERARSLTGDNRDAIQVARDLTQARRTEAQTLYGDAYNQEITVPTEIIGALRGPEGAAAIAEARRIASLERDDAALNALDNLANADFDQAVTATGKALDYIRQAYADAAQGAEGNLGAALQGRVNEIEQGLNLIPELRTARTAYRSASEQIDAVGGVPNALGRQQLGRPDRAPMNAMTTDATRYGQYVGGLSEPAQAANQVYQRDQIIQALGRGRDGAVGPMNALSAGSNLPAGPNAPIVARNLEATFPGQGQRFQQDIRLNREQVSNANFIDPNTGSPTASRLADQAAEGLQSAANVATGGKAAVVRLAIDNAIRRIGLNEAERQAIVELGIGSADEFERVIQLADQSRRRGAPPPREVRAWVVNAQNTLGAQNPVAIELQRLLLPTRAAAQEEQQ